MSQLDIYDDDEYTHDESEHQMIKERDNTVTVKMEILLIK